MSKILTVENSTLESWLRRPEIMAIIPGCMRYIQASHQAGGSCGACGDDGAATRVTYSDAKKCITLLGDSKKRELMAALRVQSMQLVVPISGKIKTLVFHMPK